MLTPYSTTTIRSTAVWRIPASFVFPRPVFDPPPGAFLRIAPKVWWPRPALCPCDEHAVDQVVDAVRCQRPDAEQHPGTGRCQDDVQHIRHVQEFLAAGAGPVEHAPDPFGAGGGAPAARRLAVGVGGRRCIDTRPPSRPQPR